MGGRRGREMRRHMGGRQLLLPGTWQGLGSEELSGRLRSPASRSVPPLRSQRWHRPGKETIFSLAKLAPYGRAIFLPHQQSILRGGGRQKDLPGPPAHQVPPGPLLGSRGRGGVMEQRERCGHQREWWHRQQQDSSLNTTRTRRLT